MNHWMTIQIICDDITPSVTRQRDFETPGGVGPIAEIMIMGQALDIGVTLLVHSVSTISDIVRQNAEVIVILGLPDEDIHFICNRFGTSQKEAQKLKILGLGEFAILNYRVWSKCVYATFSKPQIPDSCSEALRKAVVGKFLSYVKIARPAPFSAFTPRVKIDSKPSSAPTTPKLPDKALEYLTYVITGVPKTLTKIYDSLGVSKAVGSKLTQSLADLGYICVHTFSTGKRGGQASLAEVLGPGLDLLRAKGISRPKSRTNGDWEHEIAACLLDYCGVKAKYTVAFEVDLGDGMRADAQWLDPKTGQRTIFNIGISKPQREVESIVKFFKLPACQHAKFILVVRDTQFLREVEDKLKVIDPSGVFRSRVEIKLIAEYLNI